MSSFFHPLVRFFFFALIVMSYGFGLGAGMASTSAMVAACIWLGLPVLLTWWVQWDSKENHSSIPHDVGLLMLLLWPLALPQYILKTRGKGGVFLLLSLWLGMLAPFLGYGMGILYRQGL